MQCKWKNHLSIKYKAHKHKTLINWLKQWKSHLLIPYKIQRLILIWDRLWLINYKVLNLNMLWQLKWKIHLSSKYKHHSLHKKWKNHLLIRYKENKYNLMSLQLKNLKKVIEKTKIAVNLESLKINHLNSQVVWNKHHMTKSLKKDKV